VAKHLAGKSFASESRGAGPLLRPTTGRAADRLALVGDAAGYVDAVTGQGLSLAFAGAEALVAALPKQLDDGAQLSRALLRYDRSLAKAWRRYAIPARALLALARRPRLRRAALGAAARLPAIFSLIVEGIAAA
jgi:flavin-dependent dehydrogenase